MNTRLEKLQEMEKQKPADAFIKFAIAQEFVGMQHDEQAAEVFNLLLKNFPQYLPTYYQLGKLFERKEDLPSAMDIYRRGIIIAKAANDLKTAGELSEAIMLIED